MREQSIVKHVFAVSLPSIEWISFISKCQTLTLVAIQRNECHTQRIDTTFTFFFFFQMFLNQMGLQQLIIMKTWSLKCTRVVRVQHLFAGASDYEILQLCQPFGRPSYSGLHDCVASLLGWLIHSCCGDFISRSVCAAARGIVVAVAAVSGRCWIRAVDFL